MPKISVDIPQELLDDLMTHVGKDKKFVSQSDAVRTAIRKMLDSLDEVDRLHGRVDRLHGRVDRRHGRAGRDK